MRKAVVLMMTPLESCLQRAKNGAGRWASRPGIRGMIELIWAALRGFLLSAGALAHAPMPLGLGLLMNTGGLRGIVMAAGSCAGYWLFWGENGFQGMIWTWMGLVTGWFLGKQQQPLSLMAALGAFLPSAAGLGFQILWNDDTSIPIYLLRVAVGLGSGVLWSLCREGRLPAAGWIAQGVWVLALSPIGNLGFLLAGVLATGGTFPAAALAGLGLDLAGVSPVPMTAVLCLCRILRTVPNMPGWMRFPIPGGLYLLLMGLCGGDDWMPALTLTVGGLFGGLLPQQPEMPRRSDEIGQLQTRLERMAEAISQMRLQLLAVEVPPIDEQAVTARVRERACGGCPCRKGCIQRFDPVPTELLRRPLFENTTLPIPCKKPGRMVLELRRAQEQMRTLRGEREREAEYRWAVQQQYQFLSHYLQETAEDLSRQPKRLRYRPEVTVCSAGKEMANGDRCLWFPGTDNRYYILLCDGMGTGLGAADEARTGADLLRSLLTAGLPAEYALKALNSLLALCGKAGAVTVDLAEIELDTGRTAIYKWGAAPSWVMRQDRAEKIGTAAPPPGLSVTDGRETVERLSLRRGEMLILLSDGVDGEAVLGPGGQAEASSSGELAAKLLEAGCRGKTDDATAVVVRLCPDGLSTSYHASPSNSVETQDVG